jgi:signal transduction histidine kinase
VNRTLYYLLLAVIIPNTLEVYADMSSQVQQAPSRAAAAAKAESKAAQQEDQTSDENNDEDNDDDNGPKGEDITPDVEATDSQGQDDNAGKASIAFDENATPTPEEAKKIAAKAKQNESVANTYDFEAEEKQKKQAAEAEMQDELVAMGLQGPELEDMQKKRRMIVDLVRRGKKYFVDNSLDVACNTLIKSKEFVIGEVYVFVYDMDGYCLAQGRNTDNLWKDFKNDPVGTDEYGSVFVLDFIDKARTGGGWVSYRYHNASKVAYVEMVQKGNTQYIIGAGFYPQSKVYAVMNLVKGAVRFFKDSQEKNIKEDSIFSTLSYPVGRFVSGDLYIFALDETGTLMVQGERPTLVGSNVWTATDAKGKFINQEIITRLNKTTEGIWIDYISKGAPKKVYAEKVTSKDGKNYYIACGYYPDATDKKLQEIVQEGYRHMKKGVEQAFKEFNNHNDKIFHYGDLYLEVFNLQGVCVANGLDQDAIGRSFLDDKDEMGNYYMKKMLSVAENAGRGWVNQKRKNGYEWTYLEKVNVGLEQYIITAGLYPLSKTESMELLAKDAVEYLKSTKEIKFAFRDFIKRSGRFSLGDLGIFVFEPNGICIVNGSDPEYVWRNMINDKDELGRPYVKEMINAARRTPAHVKYRMNGADVLAYVERVDRGGRSFYVGSKLYTYDNIQMGGVNDDDTTMMKKNKKEKKQSK